MFQPPVPVALDRNRQRFVVVAPDGSAGEDPEVRIRA
jgi:predicted RNA-binding protein with TRAM domain